MATAMDTERWAAVVEAVRLYWTVPTDEDADPTFAFARRGLALALVRWAGYDAPTDGRDPATVVTREAWRDVARCALVLGAALEDADGSSSSSRTWMAAMRLRETAERWAVLWNPSSDVTPCPGSVLADGTVRPCPTGATLAHPTWLQPQKRRRRCPECREVHHQARSRVSHSRSLGHAVAPRCPVCSHALATERNPSHCTCETAAGVAA